MALVRNLADPDLDCSGAVIGSAFVVSSSSCFCQGEDEEEDEGGKIKCKEDGKCVT